MVEELIRSNWEIETLVTISDEALPGLEEIKAERLEANAKDMSRMSGMKTAPDALAVVKQRNFDLSEFYGHNCLVLDGIKDPGNVGSIIRTADWFGIPAVVCSPDTADLFNPKTVQSTMGSIFRTRVVFTNLKPFLQKFRKENGIVMGTMMNGKNIFKTVFPPITALVIGSESHGIRAEVLDLLNEVVTIPGGEKTESLNASVAAGIACSEWFRRDI